MKPTVHSIILDLLSRGSWYAPFEVRLQLRLAGFLDIEAVTARMRDLRKPQFGRHSVKKQRRAGTTYFEYRVELPAERQEAA